MESANSGANCNPYKNSVLRPNWNLLRIFWQRSRCRESFTKRQKDGEIMDEVRESPLGINGALIEKVLLINYLWKFMSEAMVSCIAWVSL